jgi:methionyl-tRNA formyltransferase
MSGASHRRVVLLALTGFGNPVLEALLECPCVAVTGVFTVRYSSPFPYYHERHLHELCEERAVSCYSEINLSSDQGLAALTRLAPDLIIVATFKQILSSRVLQLPRFGVVNLHPSLLPRFRGPCPVSAALMQDERVTGVTAHYATERVDDGDVLLQRPISIEPTDNDGSLRRRLALLAGAMTPELLDMFGGEARPTGVAQDRRLASSAPKPSIEDGYLERAKDIGEIRRKVRALNPLPGTSILVGERRIAVDGYIQLELRLNTGLQETEDAVYMYMPTGTIRLLKRTDPSELRP